MVTQKVITDFGAVTGDDQWLHTEPEKAALGPFGATVAQGSLLLALLPKLVPHLAPKEEDAFVTINRGYDEVRFGAPVPVDSVIQARTRAVKRDRRLDVHEFWISVMGSPRPSVTGAMLLMKRPK